MVTNVKVEQKDDVDEKVFSTGDFTLFVLQVKFQVLDYRY